MSIIQNVNFVDNKAALARPEQFISIEINVGAVLQSWRLSVFSYEWLERDGSIKGISALSPSEAEKRAMVEQALKGREPLEKPLLGIGIQDNVEIGSGKAVLLTLADLGLQTMPVHIPTSNKSDFKAFLADVPS